MIGHYYSTNRRLKSIGLPSGAVSHLACKVAVKFADDDPALTRPPFHPIRHILHLPPRCLSKDTVLSHLSLLDSVKPLFRACRYLARLFPELIVLVGYQRSVTRLLSHTVMGPETHIADAGNGTLLDEQTSWQYEDRDGGPEPSTPGGSDMHMQSGSSDAGESQFSLPVWLRESSQSYHWRWVPVRVRQAARAVVAWSNGPNPPRVQKIEPYFPGIQEAPVRFIDHYLPKRRHKAALLAFFYFCWLLTFILVLNHSAQAGNIEGYGKPQPMWCGASFW